MPTTVLLDNTVICNFASVAQLGLLEALLRGRGRWTEAVADEAARSSSWLPDLAGLATAGWLGEPIEVTDVEPVERMRRSVFGGTVDEPRRHLGEAESVYLLLHDPRYRGCRWVSDDRTAVEYARRQSVMTWETLDLFRDGVAMGDTTAEAGHGLIVAMADRGRGLRLPTGPRDLE